MEASNLCAYNKFGFCKHGKHCKKVHVDLLCEIENCEISTCEKRHPKICKFFAQYGRCKFLDYCRYKHEKPKTIKDDLLEIKEEINVLNKWILSLKEWMEKVVDEVNSDLDDVETSVDTLEMENVVFQHTIDESFNSIIILKKQMQSIFPFWCDECCLDVKEEATLRIHQKKHSRKK